MKIITDINEVAKLLKRSRIDYESKRETVRLIIDNVKNKGDSALFEYSKKFDNADLSASNIRVGEDEIANAYNEIDAFTLNALREAKKNILDFHSRQLRHDSLVRECGVMTGCLYKPVARAGIYVPGGKAAYPSTVLMCAVPAKAAGVQEIIMTTPGDKINPLTLVAARECGIDKIYRVGGAQAIAAMAYGTESVPKADVICGPGNIYVAIAKREVFGDVGVDMIAGPSEILIVADENAEPKYVAADMLSQAEHDEMATAILITTSSAIAEAVRVEIETQLKVLPKRKIASKALSENGAIVIVDTVEKGISLANKIAPEHLELCIKSAQDCLPLVTNAGAVFLGNYSPEPLGDYFAGPNHVLPTGGTANYASSLSADNFIKKINVIEYDRASLEKCGAKIMALANAEGLNAHANAIKLRTYKENAK